MCTSPLAARVVPSSQGGLRGKKAIEAYWRTGLERIPELHFEVVAVYAGVDTVVINYRNHTGALVNEVLRLNANGQVERGDGTYLETDAARAAARSHSAEAPDPRR